MPDDPLAPSAQSVGNTPEVPIFRSLATPNQNPELQQELGRIPQVVVQTAFGAPPQRGADLIAGKITGEHISSAFAMYEKDSERKSNEKRLGMYLAFATIITVLVFVLILCLLFLIYNKPEFIEKIVIAMVSFAAGGLGGFGIAKSTASKTKE
jgi:hypothetical protein